MRCLTLTLTATAALVMVACSSTTVNTDYDHQADFSSYSTFSWSGALEPDERPTRGASQIIDGGFGARWPAISPPKATVRRPLVKPISKWPTTHL